MAAQLTISICEEPNEEVLPYLAEIKDMVQNGGYLGELSEFTFDKENEYHIVTDEMIEFSLDMLTEIESLLKTQ